MDIIYPDKYFDKIKEKFPELSDAQIKNIIYYGTRSLFMMSHYNVDIKCQQKEFFVYFGEIFSDSGLYKSYRKLKLTAKYRILYSRAKKPYSGKYYFMLSKELHDNMPKKKKSGEWPIGMVRAYKIREEAELQEGTYLYEVDWPDDKGYKKKIFTEDITHYKCIAKRDSYNKFIPVSTDDKQKTVKRSQQKGDK